MNNQYLTGPLPAHLTINDLALTMAAAKTFDAAEKKILRVIHTELSEAWRVLGEFDHQLMEKTLGAAQQGYDADGTLIPAADVERRVKAFRAAQVKSDEAETRRKAAREIETRCFAALGEPARRLIESAVELLGEVLEKPPQFDPHPAYVAWGISSTSLLHDFRKAIARRHEDFCWHLERWNRLLPNDPFSFLQRSGIFGDAK